MMKTKKIDLTKANLDETLRVLGKSLDQITKNPEGGKVIIPISNGKSMVFTMPPKDKRPKK